MARQLGQEILGYLAEHECSDISSSIEASQFSSSTLAFWGVGGVRQMRTKAGVAVAVKLVQPPIESEGKDKSMKVCMPLRSQVCSLLISIYL